MCLILCPIRDITDDEACVDELRQTIRFFAAVLAHRTQKVIYPNAFNTRITLYMQYDFLVLFCRWMFLQLWWEKWWELLWSTSRSLLKHNRKVEPVIYFHIIKLFFHRFGKQNLGIKIESNRYKCKTWKQIPILMENCWGLIILYKWIIVKSF